MFFCSAEFSWFELNFRAKKKTISQAIGFNVFMKTFFPRSFVCVFMFCIVFCFVLFMLEPLVVSRTMKCLFKNIDLHFMKIFSQC